MSGSMQTKHTVPSSPAHSLVLMRANESHYLCISMLLCTGGIVWDYWVERGWNSVDAIRKCLALCLSWVTSMTISTADCTEHRITLPPYVLNDCWYFVPLNSLYPAEENMQAFLERPLTWKQTLFHLNTIQPLWSFSDGLKFGISFADCLPIKSPL